MTIGWLSGIGMMILMTTVKICLKMSMKIVMTNVNFAMVITDDPNVIPLQAVTAVAETIFRQLVVHHRPKELHTQHH